MLSVQVVAMREAVSCDKFAHTHERANLLETLNFENMIAIANVQTVNYRHVGCLQTVCGTKR